MSKEYIQALDDLFGLVAFQGNLGKAQKYFDVIEPALERLEAIDNAKSSEALKEIDRIENNIIYLLSDCDINEEVNMNFTSIKEHKSCEIIKQALLKSQEQKQVLEIIKKKVMNLVSIENGRVWDNELYGCNELTKEEFNLLKRWVDNE